MTDDQPRVTETIKIKSKIGMDGRTRVPMSDGSKFDEETGSG